VTGPFAAGLAAESDNLVLRAARGLGDLAGIRASGALVLEKNLPVASGIGGGSADAAAALRLLCRFWGVAPQLDGLAEALGADVPVCLSGRPALMSGVGEILEPAPLLPQVGLVLVNPGVAVSTPEVFRARAGKRFSEAARFPRSGWGDASALAADLRGVRNDLQAAACFLAPAIGDVLDTLGSAPGCLVARMSGSGATCFGLFPSAGAAREAADAISRPGWWVWGGEIEA
jgi:4-diphosphocytidyl-2-C-methyl-D-erythritol kinase